MSVSTEQRRLDNEFLNNGLVNRCICSLQLSPISRAQVVGGTFSLGVSVFVYLSFGFEFAVCAFLVLFTFLLAMGGNDFDLMKEKATKTKTYYSETPLKVLASDGLPRPSFTEGKSILVGDEKKRRVWSIEQEFEALRFYGSYEVGRADAGFYALQQDGGAACYFVYGFKVQGFSPCADHMDCMVAMRKLNKAFKNLPDLKLKFIWDLPADASSQILQQKELLEMAEHDALTVEIIQSRGKWAVNKEREGKLVTPSLYVYARSKVVIGSSDAVSQDWKDRWGALAATVYTRFFGDATTHTLALRAIKISYESSCLSIVRAFNSGVGLDARPMSVHEMYSRDHAQLHSTPVDSCPQYVRFTDNGPMESQQMVRTAEGDRPVIGHHILGELFSSEGVQSIPVFYRNDMWLPLKGRKNGEGNPLGKFGACVRLTQLESFSAVNNSHAIGHIQNAYQWMIGLSDVQFITEVEAQDPIDKKDRLDKGIVNRTKRAGRAVRKESQDVDSMEDISDLVEARQWLRSGEKPLSTATYVWVYADTRDKLKAKTASVMNSLGQSNCLLVQDSLEYKWIDSQPYAWEQMSHKPSHKRLDYMIKQAIPTLPLTQPQKLDDKGVGYVGKDIPALYYIDYCGEKNHTLIAATSGGGKSIQGMEILSQCIATGTPGIMLDSPPLADQSTDAVAPSTYTPAVELWQSLGVKCAYQDIKRSNFNIIGRYGLGNNSFELETLVEAHLDILYAGVVGDAPNHRLRETLINILSLSYRDFLNNSTNISKHHEPLVEDYLRHFVDWGHRYESGELNLAKIAGIEGIGAFGVTDQEREAIGLIRSQLAGVLSQPWGKRINAQTSFDTDILFLVLGLTDVRAGSKEGLTYGLAAAAFMDRMMSKYNRSVIGMDEGSTLLPMDSFAFKFAKIFPEGRKKGANGVLLMTEAETLWKSKHCGLILGNFDNVLVGYSEKTNVDQFVQRLGFKEEILSRYTQRPDLETMSSQWYLKRRDQHIELLYYTTPMLLGLGATSPTELKVKAEYARQREHLDRLTMNKHFGSDLFSAYSKGRSPHTLVN